jgi:hypothetical protein
MEKEMMKNSTRERLLQSVNENIPLLQKNLTEVISPLINDINYNKFKDELEIASIFTVATLDFLVNVKNYLSGKYFWEGPVVFKQIYKIIFESHNKIAYRTITKNGIVNIEATENNKKQSLWLSKMRRLINQENESEYNRITKLIEDFKADFDYITKIRNHDGHYNEMKEYIKDMYSIDSDKTLNLAIDWEEIMIAVYNFSNAQLNKKISHLT